MRPAALSVMNRVVSSGPPKAMFDADVPFGVSMKFVRMPASSKRNTPRPGWATTSPPSTSTARPSGPPPPDRFRKTPTLLTPPSAGYRNEQPAPVRAEHQSVGARDIVQHAFQPICLEVPAKDGATRNIDDVEIAMGVEARSLQKRAEQPTAKMVVRPHALSGCAHCIGKEIRTSACRRFGGSR